MMFQPCMPKRYRKNIINQEERRKKSIPNLPRHDGRRTPPICIIPLQPTTYLPSPNPRSTGGGQEAEKKRETHDAFHREGPCRLLPSHRTIRRMYPNCAGGGGGGRGAPEKKWLGLEVCTVHTGPEGNSVRRKVLLSVGTHRSRLGWMELFAAVCSYMHHTHIS